MPWQLSLPYWLGHWFFSRARSRWGEYGRLISIPAAFAMKQPSALYLAIISKNKPRLLTHFRYPLSLCLLSQQGKRCRAQEFSISRSPKRGSICFSQLKLQSAHEYLAYPSHFNSSRSCTKVHRSRKHRGLHTESGQTLPSSFSAVSTPIFASKY